MTFDEFWQDYLTGAKKRYDAKRKEGKTQAQSKPTQQETARAAWDAAVQSAAPTLYMQNEELREDIRELRERLDAANRMISRLHNAMPAPIYAMEGMSYTEFKAQCEAEKKLTALEVSNLQYDAQMQRVIAAKQAWARQRSRADFAEIMGVDWPITRGRVEGARIEHQNLPKDFSEGRRLLTTAPDDARIGANFGGVRD